LDSESFLEKRPSGSSQFHKRLFSAKRRRETDPAKEYIYQVVSISIDFPNKTGVFKKFFKKAI
jgi:hypothetical protein